MSAFLRAGSGRTYSLAWASWSTWYQAQGIHPAGAGMGSLLNYKGLSFGTIALHRAVVSTCLDPASAVPLGPILWSPNFSRRSSWQGPQEPEHKSTWDVADVVDMVVQWSPLDERSLLDLSSNTVTPLAFYSFRRVSNLSLLDIGPIY